MPAHFSTTTVAEQHRAQLDKIATETSRWDLEAQRRTAEIAGLTDITTAIDARLDELRGKPLVFDVTKDNDEIRGILTEYKKGSPALDTLRLKLRAGDISDDEFRRQYADLTKNLNDRLDAIHARAEQQIEKARAKRKLALDATLKPAGDTTEQLLAETRAARILDRVRGDIDHANSSGGTANPYEILSRVLDNVDPATARVIYEESASLMRHIPDASHVIETLIADKNPRVSAANADYARAQKYGATTAFNLTQTRNRIAQPPMPDDRESISTFEQSIVLAEPQI